MLTLESENNRGEDSIPSFPPELISLFDGTEELDYCENYDRFDALEVLEIELAFGGNRKNRMKIFKDGVAYEQRTPKFDTDRVKYKIISHAEALKILRESEALFLKKLNPIKGAMSQLQKI